MFPKPVETCTFTERMFHVMTLGRQSDKESPDAILKPIAQQNCPVHFSEQAVKGIVDHSGGYPYFIQFHCREMFDSYLQQKAARDAKPRVTVSQTVRKLDSDFFAGRWTRVTDVDRCREARHAWQAARHVCSVAYRRVNSDEIAF